ncbi:MAG: hypothetical protein IJG49_07520 [Erysipelotrichaceae bacterium]|nr:hypothetical protein [Erysipelotrichaceae bacterium]
MELAYLRILADAVDPGIGGLNDDPMMVAVLAVVVVTAVFAIRHFYKKKKGK